MDNGKLDKTFSGDGKAEVAGTAEAFDLTLQPDGRIVVVGGDGGGWRVVRLEPNGSLDSSFGTGGIQTTPMGTNATFGAQGVSIDPSGKIVVAGGAALSSSGTDFAAARYQG
jgi:uncharacterized delta-60 repeat protein